MDEHAHMNENAGPYAGLDRFAARKRVLEDLRAAGISGGREGLHHRARQMRPLRDGGRAAAFDAVVHQTLPLLQQKNAKLVRCHGVTENPFRGHLK